MSASRHEHPNLGPPELIEVADGVFAYVQPDGSWYINNTGFVVGPASVISVDACSTERRTRAYLDRIATVSKAPVSMLINTHHHGDHTYGNSLFGPATIIAQEKCWLDRERIVGNLHRAYADLGAAGGVDVITALTDMVAYNIGQPLSCFA